MLVALAYAPKDNEHNPSRCIFATTTVTVTVHLAQNNEMKHAETRTRLRTDVMKEMENNLSGRYKI